jgi:hypothetical protein
MPHEPGTAAPLGTTSPEGATSLAGTAGPAGAAGPARCGWICPVARPRSQTFPSPRAQLG